MRADAGAGSALGRFASKAERWRFEETSTAIGEQRKCQVVASEICVAGDRKVRKAGSTDRQECLHHPGGVDEFTDGWMDRFEAKNAGKMPALPAKRSAIGVVLHR